MSVVQISSIEELEDLRKAGRPVVVDFSALSWCVPCQRLKPHYDAVSEKVDAVFAYVDIDTADPSLIELFDVRGVPLVLAFSDIGKTVIQSRTAPALQREISALIEG